MRAVVQRAARAEVSVQGKIAGSIGKGVLVLLGISQNDTFDEVKWLADKIVGLRIFDDNEGKMNLSLLDIGAEMLVVSQFTLYGDCRKGKRPSYSRAARPEQAVLMYNEFVEYCKSKYDVNVNTGVFQAHMDVSLINDGPVTLIIDSDKSVY